MAYRLFVDSSNGLTIYPEYDFQQGKTKIQDASRSRSAALYQYKWAAYDTIKFSVSYVNSEMKSIVNSWWESNTDLLFKSESETAVYSVHIVNKKSPIGGFVRPYDDLYEGKIELEGY